jgi:hypothetical protein
MQSESDLDIARKLTADIHANYPSSDFYLKADAPVLVSIDITKDKEKLKKMLIEDLKRIELFKSYMTNYSRTYLIHILTKWRVENKKPVENISLHVSAAFILGHGECDVLTELLVYNLMKKNIRKIGASDIIFSAPFKGAHKFAFVEYQNARWVVDPYLNICCPEEDYYQHEKLIAYFQALNRNIKITADFIKKFRNKEYREFSFPEYTKHLPMIERMIKENTSLNDSVIGDLKKEMAYVKEVHLNPQKYDPDKAFACLSKYFFGVAQKTDSFADLESDQHTESYIEACLADKPSDDQKLLIVGFQNKAHEWLIKMISYFAKKDAVFSNVLEAVDAKNFSQALRRVCAKKEPKHHEQVYKIAKVLLVAKVLTKEALNEFGGELGGSIHYIATTGNEKVFDLLKEAGANPDVQSKNKDKETAQQILERVLKEKQSQKIPSVKDCEKFSIRASATLNSSSDISKSEEASSHSINPVQTY